MSAAAATVTEFRDLIRLHREHAAAAKTAGQRLWADSHEALADGYTIALEVLEINMRFAGEEVPA